jgi:DNA-binding MarR family transcriptional regulator
VIEPTKPALAALLASPDEDLAEAVLTVSTLSRGLERVLDGMTLAQYRILTLIGSSPQRAGRLAERAALSKSTLTGLLDGLTARGWVVRTEVAGDRRGVGLDLTDAGRTIREQAEQAMVERLEHYLGFVSAEERSAATEGLAVLHRAVLAAWEARQ